MPRKERVEILYARLTPAASKWVGSEVIRTNHFQSTIITEALDAAREQRVYKLDEKVFKTEERLKEAAAKRKKRARRRT